MRGFFLGLLAPLIVGPLLVAGFLGLAAGHPTNQSAQIMRAKLAKGHEIEGSKLVLAGGSNVRYSLRAGEVERLAGRPALNLALAADLGVDYLLFLMRQVLRPGDIAVLAIEYSFYADDQILTRVNAPLALWNSTDWVRGLPLSEQILWARNLTVEAGMGGLASRLGLARSLTLPVGVFNEWGDHVGNDSDAATRLQLADLSGARAEAERFRFNADSASTLALSRFMDWCAANGVRVAAAWPTWGQGLVDSDRFFRFAGEVREFYEAHGAHVLGTPEEAMLPVDQLYDSPWHANTQGALLRTSRLVADLANARLLAPADSSGAEPLILTSGPDR